MLRTTNSLSTSESIPIGKGSTIEKISGNNGKIDKVVVKANIVSKANTETF